MDRFVEGDGRRENSFLPASLDDYVSDDNPQRVVEAFINELDLTALGFEGIAPATTGRPACHRSKILKTYLYGYLNNIQSSRRLERVAGRNIELMWLTSRLAPYVKLPTRQWRCDPRRMRAVRDTPDRAQQYFRTLPMVSSLSKRCPSWIGRS